ncbi:hypothetical protein [Paraburkholderia sp. C35]|uniref:hypothetical protein n=1 Tax=Paraburkholderia sp. C35 TaxID=2126993 RepID=UPI000D695118|nr:hypothetical protein [Paraburkholderia sp. C35]
MTPNAPVRDTARDSRTKRIPENVARIPVVADAIPDSTLAKKIVSARTHPSRVLPSHFIEAIERAYAPAKRFWCHVDPEQLANETVRHNPEYMNAVSQSWAAWGCGSFYEDLVNAIQTKKFDEHCAVVMRTLPEEILSGDDETVYDLLHSRFTQSGESTHLKYLELDGVKAVRYIRETMENMLD